MSDLVDSTIYACFNELILKTISMKQTISVIVILFLATSLTNTQNKVVPNMPFSTLNSNPGFITINEVTYGLVLNGTTSPFSK